MIRVSPGFIARLEREAQSLIPALSEARGGQVRAYMDRLSENGGLEEEELLALTRLLRSALAEQTRRDAPEQEDAPDEAARGAEGPRDAAGQRNVERLERMMQLLSVIRQRQDARRRQALRNANNMGRR